MDKGDVVRIAATAAAKTLLKLLPPESTHIAFRQLEDILEKGKWRTKVGALDSIRGFADRAKDEVASELVTVLPKVELTMHDTKPEVSNAAKKCATALCTTVANPDLTPHIPILVECMSNPSSVPACMKALSSTTFVAEVTAPALAVVVPLLLRALNDRSMEVQRRTVVVIDNLVKLVRDPAVAARYLSTLVERMSENTNLDGACVRLYVNDVSHNDFLLHNCLIDGWVQPQLFCALYGLQTNDDVRDGLAVAA